MDRSQGTTLGAIVLAGLFLRPGTSVRTQPADVVAASNTAASATQGTSTPVGGAGPWIASCRYWAPARQVTDQSNGESAKVSGTLKATTGTLDLRVTPSLTPDEQEGVCPKEMNDPPVGDEQRWGLPSSFTGARTRENTPNINSLIAIIPDPVHTQMALEFDRRIDALIQAAGDNGYVSSYNWLPWKNRAGGKVSETAEGMESAHDTKREREPGLIILKYVPDESSKDLSPDVSFYKVIYLFLVAETPTVGVDGFQLRKAFEYEDMLKKKTTEYQEMLTKQNSGISPLNRAKSDDGYLEKKCAMTIIGPVFTGSAASLRVAIAAEIVRKPPPSSAVCVDGATSTRLAPDELDNSSDKVPVRYRSFASNQEYDQEELLELLDNSNYHRSRVAVVSEDDTVLGRTLAHRFLPQAVVGHSPLEVPLSIRFPHGISQLRNAYADQPASESAATSPGAPPSPYLHLSLRDRSIDDSVPHFSADHTPLSQEAGLMTIARQLQRYRAQFILIDATDSLDELFLAQFLHRACPDARLVFPKGDLLLEREIDNVPFVGALTVTPYHLMGLGNTTGGGAQRAYPDSETQAYYNAASYALWDGQPHHLHVASYQNILDPVGDIHPPLFVTTIGLDGYYPLAMINDRASDNGKILPDLPSARSIPDSAKPPKLPIYPSLLWRVLCGIALLLSFVHGFVLLIASYKSPFTHDLAIEGNVEPRRRSMNLHIGTAMLFCMDAVLAIPLFPTFRLCIVDWWGVLLSVGTLASGFWAVAMTFYRTWRYIRWEYQPVRQEGTSRAKYIDTYLRRNAYFLFDLIAWFALSGVPVIWTCICCKEWINGVHTHVGLYFSIRCVNPGSGVSPVIPMLFLLFSWYLWAVFQTRRMRFSSGDRPILPEKLGRPREDLLFVSDEDLKDCNWERGCLYKNMTCLLITREVLHRFLKDHEYALDFGLLVSYFLLFGWLVFFTPVRSLDHFLWNTRWFSTPYEVLISALLFPLLVIAFCGWLRMIFIWGALRRGLLERLEQQPIRYAFNRLKGVGWMTMLSRGGQHEQRRDMTRLTESIHQMTHDPGLRDKLRDSPENYLGQLESIRERLDADIEKLAPHSGEVSSKAMNAIEQDCAKFCTVLLQGVLIPYWEEVRHGTVEGEDPETIPIKASRSQLSREHPDEALELRAAHGCNDPDSIQVAEEFLVIHYVSLIRAVLVNLRPLMLFVTASFVLAMVGLNSYPFQPRQIIDWCFTGILIFMGSGIIWVFAQMHRDAILSRITDTKASELGADFYIRIATFGAVPVLTWLAYQFPDIGGTIFKLLSPAVGVVK
jgi:hypothetical protein